MSDVIQRRPIDRFMRKQPWASPGRGPTGRRLCCCGCGREVGKGRSSSAGPECVRWWKSHSDLNHIKFMVKERDHGVCALCGADTERMRAAYHAALVEFGETVRAGYSSEYRQQWPLSAEQVARCDYGCAGFPKPPAGFPGLGRRWWEADHIVPVAEGGGGCDFSGYRTLCVPCHRTETKNLAGRLAKKRRAEKEANATSGRASKV